MNPMKICVIIPAYNEAATIGSVIKAARAYVPDILVINDGSTDKTEEQSRANGAVVLTFRKNQGKGEGLKSGFDYAVKNNYDAVITMDGDGQHSPGDILNIIESAAPPAAGVVVGNRMAAPKGMPPVRFVTNLFMSFIISAVCRQNIPDSQCGFRLIKCGVLRNICILSSRYEIESEILIKASRLGFKIISAPIKSVYEGQSSFINPVLDTWRFFSMLFKVLLFESRDAIRKREKCPGRKAVSREGD